jgi:WD40 repeat protein
MVYTTQFSKYDDGEMFMAGGSMGNELRFFDTLNSNRPFASINDLDSAVLDCDFSHMGTMAAVGCADGTAKIYNLSKL